MAKNVDHVGRVVRGAVESLRRLMVDIYPPDLSGTGLPGAIDDLAEPLRHSGVTVNVHAEPLPGADSDVAATLYRIAKETLANVAKHAEASTVDVDLTVDDTGSQPCIVLRVADDGVGIREGQLDKRAEGHLGLRLLIDRVADQGGELTVTRRPEGGTLALARVPLGAAGTGAFVPSPRPAVTITTPPVLTPGGRAHGTPGTGTSAGEGDADDRARADSSS